MRRVATFVTLVALAMSIPAVALAARPPGKGKPPGDPVVISLTFEYSGPAAPQPTDRCVFAELFSWNANVRGGTFDYVITDDEGETLTSASVPIGKTGPATLAEFEIAPAYPGDTFVVLHEATLYDRKGRVVATYDDDPTGKTVTCNEWNDNP